MKETTFSQKIANVIHTFLTEADWNYSFDDKSGVFQFYLSLKSKIKSIKYRIRVRADDYTVYALSPIGADEDDAAMMASMAEFVCRANYGLRNGNFELDMRDGEIRFKSYVDCEGIVPSQEIVLNSIHCPAAMFETYGDGILGILFSGLSAKEAIALCEKSDEDRLRSTLTALCQEDGGDEIAAMLSRLAARMGIEGFEPVGEPDGTTEVPTHIKTSLFTEEGDEA